MKRFSLHLITLVCLLSICLNSQTNDSIQKIFDSNLYTDSEKAEKFRAFISDNYLERQTDSAYLFINQLIKFAEKKNLKKEKADAFLLLADINRIFNDNDIATKNARQSLEIYQELKDKQGMAKALHSLGNSYKKIYNLDEAKKLYEQSLKISKEVNDTLTTSRVLFSIANIYLWRFKNEESLDLYRESLNLAQSQSSWRDIGAVYNNIASIYINKKEYQTAYSYILKTIKIGDSLHNYNLLTHAYTTLSFFYLKQNKYDKLIASTRKQLEYANKINHNERIDGAYYFFTEAYKGKRDIDSVIKYLNLRKTIRSTIDDIKSVQSLNKLKIDNAKTKDSLLNLANAYKTEMAYQKEKNNLTLAWGGSLSAVSIIAFLVYRNTKRKQRKAEEGRQKQIEEKEKILKDLELSTIDAMIQGQEKERQRLAADLHDSVGATLSAAKLQFNHLIKDEIDAKVREELIKKTSTLLEDAYVEIRSMAHLKNSGVIAKNGLLPAIEKLTENASGINNLSFEVQSFGLDKRLDNTLEITIFRIIQELVTNIIKHAKATKGSIHLTNHENILNIMVEDDGIGFNPKQITKTNKGMGINSIDKRVEHLDGKMTIESEKNNGTTVIIDIPI